MKLNNLKLIWIVICWTFPLQDSSPPTQFYVSRWYSTPDIGMAFSFIPVNAGANAFNNMQEDVQEKIYFAGEVSSCVLSI